VANQNTSHDTGHCQSHAYAVDCPHTTMSKAIQSIQPIRRLV